MHKWFSKWVHFRSGGIPWPEPANSKNVLENPEITWKLIQDEINKGFILGPFNTKPFPNLLCIPINIVEKETSLGLYRLVQDFSYPWNDNTNSINALVPNKNKRVNYGGIDDVARIALELGSPSWAVHLDIKHAFKCLPLAPSQWHLTGLCFKGAYFIQTQTPFGASASCLHFEKVAMLLKWIIQNELPWAHIMNYLDDFWLTQKTETKIWQLAQEFIWIIEQEIGFPICHNKTLRPAMKLNFVGLTADLINLCILLPDDKKTKALSMISKILAAHRKGAFMPVKDLEKCTGMLNYACQAIPIGHPWLQSVYAL